LKTQEQQYHYQQQQHEKQQQQQYYQQQLLQQTINEKEQTIKSHEQTIKSHEQTIKNHEQTIKNHEQTIKTHEQTIFQLQNYHQQLCFPPNTPDEIIKIVTGEKRKLAEFEEIGVRQKNRRLEIATTLIEWILDVYKIPKSELDTIIMRAKKDITEKLPKELTPLSPENALQLKDEITLADWAYQVLRNDIKQLPSLKKVKQVRALKNSNIEKKFNIQKRDHIIYASIKEVLSFAKEKHNTNTFKFTFDHRKNEGQDKVLIAIIPENISATTTSSSSHTPNHVYPICLYVGKEEDIYQKAEATLNELNEVIRSKQVISF
jgi:hypothetical protein